MSCGRQSRTFAAAFAVLSALSSRPSNAQVTLQVVAQPRINSSVHCQKANGECLIQGSLEDELGNPLPNQELRLSFELPTLRNGSLPKLRPCDDIDSPQDSNTAISSRTNETGRFCFRVEGGVPADAPSVSIAYAGTAGYEGAVARLALGNMGSPATLAVLNGPSRVALEAGSFKVEVQLSAIGRSTVGLPILLELFDLAFRENKTKETELARSTTNTEGIAQFTMASALLGHPGPARLRARFAGLNGIPPASITWPILKTCSVRLQARLESRIAEVGDFAAVDANASSGCGTVSEGSIEFSLNHKPQVTLPVKEGHVRWSISTFQLSPGEYSVGARYVPSSSGYTTRETTAVTLQISPISARRRALWLSSGGLVLLWFVWRWRSGYSKPRVVTAGTKIFTKPQSLEVEPSSNPDSGWVGIVIDSHTGIPIEGASVAIVSPGFAEIRREVAVETASDGSFRLPHREASTQARLSVSASRYLGADWSMPNPGRLIVRLETRRRAVVRIFVQWAEKLRPRAPSDPEPTPADVIALAKLRSLPKIDEWAKTVEQAAFGPDTPNAEEPGLLSPPDMLSPGSKAPK